MSEQNYSEKLPALGSSTAQTASQNERIQELRESLELQASKIRFFMKRLSESVTEDATNITIEFMARCFDDQNFGEF